MKVSIKEKGAELASLYHKEFRKDFLWDGNPQFWGRQSPILFPIVGKLKDDEYKIGDKKYKMPQHGFARDSNFELIGKSTDRATFLLKENEESLKNYPFKFLLYVVYELTGNTLRIAFRVENNFEDILPFSIGFHPAFVCPFEEDEELENYALFFEKEENLERLILENGLISSSEKFILQDRILALDEGIFIRDAIILKNPESKSVTLSRRDKSGEKIGLDFENFEYLGLWKKLKARFLCIEPWLGINDYKRFEGDFLKKEGIVILKRNKYFQRQIKITITL